MFSLLAIYTEKGHQYEDKTKKVLTLVEEHTISIEIDSSVEKIVGGTSSSSAFNLCARNIRRVTFAVNSQLLSFGENLLSKTSVEYVDFSNCLNLKRIETACCHQCTNLKTFIFPPNVESFGEGALNGATVEEITLPDSLKTIAGYSSIYGAAFSSRNLKKVNIKPTSNLSFIGPHAFMNCNIETFFIPEKVTALGVAVFLGTPIREFTVDSKNQYFSTDGTTVYNKDGTQIIFISNKDFGTDYTINSNVKEILNQAFRGVPSKKVIFTNQSIVLNPGCFSDSNIVEFSYPTGLTEVTPSVIENSKHLTTVTLHEGITKIGSFAFSKCTKLTTIVLPNTLETICAGAFNGCTGLTTLTIPESVNTIEAGAFSGCSSQLQFDFKNASKFAYKNGILYCDSEFVDYIVDGEDNDIVIPKSLNGILNNMFTGKRMRSVTFEEVSNTKSIGVEAFKSSSVKTIVFPPCLETIMYNAFTFCNRLESVKFTGAIKEIQHDAFYSCARLQTVTFSEDNELTVITTRAFNLCNSLIDFNFANLKKLEKIQESAFESSFKPGALVAVNIQPSVTVIESNAFQASKIGSLAFSYATNISTISSYSFYECNELTRIVFSPLTTKIDIYAFSKCDSLERVNLGKGISIINQYAFSYSSKLSVVFIPNGSALKNIMGFAFKDTQLTSFETENETEFFFNKGLLMNGKRTNLIYFISSKDIISVILPSSIETIGDFAFQNAVYLREVIISEGNFRKVGFHSFEGCTQLRRLSLPDTLEEIDVDAFKDCNKILCGGLYLKDGDLVERARVAGISEKALSKGCRNNLKMLMNKKTQQCYHAYNILRTTTIALFIAILA